MDKKYALKSGNNLLSPFIIFTICSSIFFGCKDKSCKDIPDISSIKIQVERINLENKLMNVNSWEEVETFLGENRVFADYFLHADQYPHDSILAKRVFRLLKAPAVDTLFMESKKTFANMDDILADYKQAYQIINYHFPNTPAPKLATVVTAFYNDLYISDSLIIVGLDYFLGARATFRPDEHQYILKRFKKESLIPTIMNFVSNEFNKIDLTHHTLLSDMVNIGKSFYFTSQVLPCTPDSLIIGYTAEEMKLVNENQEIIWANLIENELLYERNDYMKNKFIGERPNVSEISENCPGRVGAWLGWEIVKKYMDKNSDVTVSELMAETDAHKIFQMAKYRPKNSE